MGSGEWLKDEHPKQLGKLVGNLQSIEMLARLYLAIKAAGCLEKAGPNVTNTKKGDEVELTPLSDPRSLEPVLKDYNLNVNADQKVSVEEIILLRDALAHGRVFGSGPLDRGHLKLLKFAKKKQNGKVEVTLCEDMSDDWFKQKIALLEDATQRIQGALNFDKTILK